MIVCWNEVYCDAMNDSVPVITGIRYINGSLTLTTSNGGIREYLIDPEILGTEDIDEECSAVVWLRA